MTVLRPGEHPDELISSSLTGDLTAAEQEALTTHLAGCQRCRETLAAFSEERRLLSGMRHVQPPRDLSARVRAGIESGRLGGLPWWRRPAFLGISATVATVAAGILAVVILNRPPDEGVGNLSPSAQPSASQPVSASIGPSASINPTDEPLPTPTINPQAFLRPGELGYFSLTGGSQEPPRLSFIKNETGESVEAEDAPSGPPIAAALSPNAEWIAYITEVGLSGFNQVWALHLTDGQTVRLGCAMDGPFADRLLWSSDSIFLAYTLPAVVDLGEGFNCGGGTPGDRGSTDVWAFRTDTGEISKVTDTGDAFAADMTGADQEGGTGLLISHAAETPWTEQTRLPAPLDPDAEASRADGVFLPLYSRVAGGPAIYWTGSMSLAEQDGGWQFTSGGLPQVGQLNFAGESDSSPLFTDLTQVGGAGFEDGHFAWGQDGDLIAFWGGRWNGVPQGDDYPNELAAYAGRLTDGGLSQASRLDVPTDADTARIISVAFQPDGVRAVVSVGESAPGDFDPASANLFLVPIGRNGAVPLGGAIDPPPWDGPAVFGPEPQGYPF
jgi:putative zinc finger protein